MAKQWLRVRKSDDRVKGWHRSGKATEIPADTVEVRHVEATSADLEEYDTLQQQSVASGRDGTVLYPEAGSLELPVDDRVFARIETDKAEIDADGVDYATLTFSKLNPNATVDTTFNTTRKMELYDRLLKLVFVDGVATKQFKTLDSGTYVIESTTKLRLENPVSIDAVE